MVVINADLGDKATWEGIAHAVICKWTENGVTPREGYAASCLEVVGSKVRRSNSELYEGITAIAEATVTTLMADGRRDAALGAFRMWSDLAGHLARDVDRLRLQQLADHLQPKSD
jgi:hypothetical protein